MKLFLDTSAFAKRYVAEGNSDTVAASCAQADDLVVSVVCIPELMSTLCRLLREKRLTREQYRRLKRHAMADLADIDVCQMTADVLDSTVVLLEKHTLRTMDALHVACALAVAPDIFMSADRLQLVAARRSGLKIVDVST